MQPAQTHVTIDGVAVPVAQALDAVRELAAGSEDVATYLQNGLAQAIGPLMQESADGCKYVKQALRKYLAGLRKAVQRGNAAVMYPLGYAVGDLTNQSQQLRETLVSAVSGSNGAQGLGPPAPVSINPPVISVPVSGAQPPVLTGATGGAPAGTRLATGAGFPAPPSAPPCHFPLHGTGGYATMNGRCGVLELRFQCHGTDGQPAWLVYVVFTDANLGASPVAGSVNYDNFSPADKSFAWGDGNIDAAVAAAQSNLAAFAQTCNQPGPGPQPIPPQPVPPPPIPPGPQPQPAPPPPPPPPLPTPVGASCPTPPAICAPDDKPPKIDCPAGEIPDFLVIGSKAFCDQVAVLRAAFVDLGKKVAAGFASITVDSPGASLVPAGANLQLQWVTDLTNLVSAAMAARDKENRDDVIQTIRQSLSCWFKLLNTSKACNLTEVVLLAVFKGFIEILQRFRLGWDIAIWGTIDISVHIPPLVKVLDYLINDACPAEIPEPGETIETWIKGQITDDQAKCWLSLRGVAWDVWYPVIHGRRETLHVDEYIQAARRNGADDNTIIAGLRILGFVDQPEAAARLLVYDQLPTISDVLHFLQRNVFDQQYVQDFGLMDGFATRFWPRYGQGLRAIGVQEQTAKDHYAAHWINPSIGQLSEMVQRNRPGRVDPSIQFTTTDYLRVLAEQDVAPYFRQRLLNTSYRTISVRYLQQLAQQNLITQAELAERWQDLGNTPKDAPILAQMTWNMGQRQRAQYMKGYTPSVVAKLWPAGQITRADAYKALAPLGMQQADVDTLLDVSTKEVIASQYEKHTIKSIADYASLATKAYEDGVVSAADAIAALQRAGYSLDAATLEIQSADLRAKVKNINTARKAIRSAFLRGELNAGDAVNALQLAGVLPGPAATDVSLWTLQLTVPRKAQSRSMILKWAKDGIISVANAETRLINLGYSPDTVGLDILDLAQTIKAAQAAAASRRAAQLARAQAAAQKAVAATQKAFCRLYTPAKMKLWYAERIIDESTYRDRLTKCGYNAEQIQLSFEEAQVARAKRDDESRKKGPSGVEYTGPGADRS